MLKDLLYYPFDSGGLLENKRKLKKELLKNHEENPLKFVKLKIALLSGTTIGQLKDILELFLLNRGIIPEFYVGQYNRFYEECLFGEELEQFKPELIYIHTSMRNLCITSETMYEQLTAVWNACLKRFHCAVIQNNFEIPKTQNQEERDFVVQLNQRLQKAAEESDNLYIQDLNYLSACAGLNQWYDDSLWYFSKYPFSVDVFPLVCNSLANLVQAILGRRKKVLILDLDNTLWGGVIGEIGAEGIILGVETSEGMAFAAFQSFVKQLSKNGILLAIASKNEESIAMQGFDHLASVLKREDFSVIKANWSDKNISVSEIMIELNILEDSVVYIDDNPAECQLIREVFPDMEVIEFKNPIQAKEQIEERGYFLNLQISKEDMQRTQYYAANQLRQKELEHFKDYKAYLKSLEMKCKIEKLKTKNLERVFQLINKTNQFNLTARRYTKEELEWYLNNSHSIVLVARLQDKFGDNGIVSVLIGEIKKCKIHIVLWVMSCRVFKRDLELAIFDELVDQCMKKGMDELVGYYFETPKNHFVKDLYKTLGFTQNKTQEEWYYTIQKDIDYIKKNTVMEVVCNE